MIERKTSLLEQHDRTQKMKVNILIQHDNLHVFISYNVLIKHTCIQSDLGWAQVHFMEERDVVTSDLAPCQWASNTLATSPPAPPPTHTRNKSLTFSWWPMSGLCHVSILIRKLSFMYSFWGKGNGHRASQYLQLFTNICSVTPGSYLLPRWPLVLLHIQPW